LELEGARQGNPLFNEGLVAIVDKDLYSRTSPSDDAKLFKKYALQPELAQLLNKLVFNPPIPGIEADRTDIARSNPPPNGPVHSVERSTGHRKLSKSCRALLNTCGMKNKNPVAAVTNERSKGSVTDVSPERKPLEKRGPD
jgi:hypothetical protein